MSNKDNNIELKNLIGKHIFTGVEMMTVNRKTYGEQYEDCCSISFVLDGIIYTALENPDDGYRSNMEYLHIENNIDIKNRFLPCHVIGKMRENDEYEENDVLDLIDIETKKIVLSVGTANVDDYYPYFIAKWTPENMICNQIK